MKRTIATSSMEKRRLFPANDGRKMRLFINGKPDGQTDLAPVRTFGNCTVFLGGGMAGYENYAGLLDELSVKGL